jgi:hypothetical protein
MIYVFLILITSLDYVVLRILKDINPDARLPKLEVFPVRASRYRGIHVRQEEADAVAAVVLGLV